MSAYVSIAVAGGLVATPTRSIRKKKRGRSVRTHAQNAALSY
jgi:hypothetical protein